MNSTQMLYGLLILAGLGFVVKIVKDFWSGIGNDPDDHEDDPFMKRPDDKKSIDNKD